MTSRQLPPPTDEERQRAAASAAAIRAAIADPSEAGEPATVHLDLSRPRRGVWLTTWSKLGGLSLERGRKVYTHPLLPGWEYTVAELKTEMLEDLDRLAAEGVRPTVATRERRAA